MPATYEPIATTTLGSAASGITFSSIPNTYTDLRIVFTGLSDTSDGAYVLFKINGDTAANYSATQLYGDGTSALSSRGSANTPAIRGLYQSWLNANIPGLVTADFFSYAGSTFKTVLVTASNDKNGSGTTERTVGLWRSTSAITSIQVASEDRNFGAGSTATLYGILKA